MGDDWSKIFKNSEDFETYLDGLSTSDNPFNCRHLRVLPESVGYEPGDCTPYRKGTKICVLRISNKGYNGLVCGINQDSLDREFTTSNKSPLRIDCITGHYIFNIGVDGFMQLS